MKNIYISTSKEPNKMIQIVQHCSMNKISMKIYIYFMKAYFLFFLCFLRQKVHRTFIIQINLKKTHTHNIKKAAVTWIVFAIEPTTKNMLQKNFSFD